MFSCCPRYFEVFENGCEVKSDEGRIQFKKDTIQEGEEGEVAVSVPLVLKDKVLVSVGVLKRWDSSRLLEGKAPLTQPSVEMKQKQYMPRFGRRGSHCTVRCQAGHKSLSNSLVCSE